MADSYVVAYKNGWDAFLADDLDCPYSILIQNDLWNHFQDGWNAARAAYNRDLMKDA